MKYLLMANGEAGNCLAIAAIWLIADTAAARTETSSGEPASRDDRWGLKPSELGYRLTWILFLAIDFHIASLLCLKPLSS